MESQGIDRTGSATAIKMIVFSAFIGVSGGFATVIFRKLIAFIHNVFFLGNISFTYNENLHASSIWGIGIILVPVLGSILAIWIIETFAADQRGLSVPAILLAIFYKDGKINPVTALAKTIASAITIGTGGSVGREGPVFQIGATISSIVSDFTKLSIQQRKALIAAGVAACTASIFHAPFSGILFAAEILIVPISIFGIVLAIIATVFSISVEYYFIDLKPLFTVQILAQHITTHNLFLYILFGAIAGVTSILFIRCTYWTEDFFNRHIKNVYFRHMSGMLVVGCMIYLIFRLFGHYYIEGIGLATIQDCLNRQILEPRLLLLLVVAKLLATCLTLGSGASGGVFSPSLFIGAVLGSAFAMTIHYLFPASGVDTVLFTLLGMAAILGSTTGALLTSTLLTMEMTRIFQPFIPIMLTVISAYVVRHYLCRENIYSLKLNRNGISYQHRYYN
jgi:CIC family chloride channel protein